jgi:hypothetical protein
VPEGIWFVQRDFPFGGRKLNTLALNLSFISVVSCYLPCQCIASVLLARCFQSPCVIRLMMRSNCAT